MKARLPHLLQIVTISGLIFACKPTSESSTVSSSGGSSTDASPLSYSCVVDNYSFEGETNFQSCPYGIRFAVTDFEANDESLQADFLCYTSPQEANPETVVLNGGSSSWQGETKEVAAGNNIQFKLLPDGKGQVLFERLPLQTNCSSYTSL